LPNADPTITIPENNVLIYGQNYGGKTVPMFTSGEGNRTTQLQISTGLSKVAIWQPAAGNTTLPAIIGIGTPQTTGTATARVPATTNFFTKTSRLGIVQGTASTTAIASWRGPNASWTLGFNTSPYTGGFYAIFRWGISDALTSGRSFVGMTSSVVAPTSVEPSTLTNGIGMGSGTADTTMRIFYGGTAAQTPINLGANFPSQTNSVDVYELVLYSAPNATAEVDYKVTRLNTGAVAKGTLTAAIAGTQLPSNSTYLSPRFWRAANGTVSGNPAFDILSFYIENDY